MKFRKSWFLPLALLCLGGTAATKKAIQSRSASREAPETALSPDEPSKGTGGKSMTRCKKSEAASIAELRAILLETGIGTKERYRQIGSLVGNLSLETVMELLDDPAAFATGTSPDDHAKFPLRRLIHTLLWQRFGELAPELALEKAFPDGERTKDTSVFVDSILEGIARTNPRMAFDAWKSPFGDASEDVFMSLQPATFFSYDFFKNWATKSPGEAFAALEELGTAMRASAYMGYARSLPTDADWKTEVKKFEKLFPDSKDRSFSSQKAACSLASSWVLADHEAAFAWVESLPVKPASANASIFASQADPRHDAYGQMIAAWIRTEPAEAAEWLQKWDPPGSNDHFYARIIRYRGSEDVAISSTVLGLISDPAIRDKVVRGVLSNDFQKREVLRMWENSPQLSPELRAEVTEAIRVRDEKGSGWTL